MDLTLKTTLQIIANTIRHLSIDAIEKAASGHPGLPLGCSELGAYLYGAFLQHNPKNPHWINRDRFVLSAGHGSMLLYSCLHLSGFGLSIEEIKNFRQAHSHTPGHPEYGSVPGVEATSGPLGQGVGNAVGLALSMKILEAKFSSKKFPLINNKIVCLAGDGCIMEGVSAEASSLAGHWKLNNLILIYDSNKVSLDGPLSESSSENTKKRYLAYNWDVFEIDGHNLEEIDQTFQQIRKKQKKPTLIIANTIIGHGSFTKAGTHKVHGSPLGEEEAKATKKSLGLSEEHFFVPQEVKEFFAKRLQEQQQLEENWQKTFQLFTKKHPQKVSTWQEMQTKALPSNLEEEIIQNLPIAKDLSTRESSGLVLEFIASKFPFIYGGSADLSSSDKTFLKQYGIISQKDFSGRNIKFGAREFAMATITSGLYLSGMMIPYCGTFLAFSDYMRNAIRLASLSSYHTLYLFTHDSIFLAEDGPTHQPVEQLASLRAIPNLQVIRPASFWETKMAWLAALHYKGPTAIILSRQTIPERKETHLPYHESMAKGAYIIKKAHQKPDFVIYTTGSEVPLALQVAEALEQKQKITQVVSFPCFSIFDQQPESYKKTILLDESTTHVSIEAARSFGWHKYIGSGGISISVETFGLSAPAKDIQKEFGFTVEAILQKLL